MSNDSPPELGVAYILEGSVRKYGDQFRVTTQLIDVASGNHLWSDTYDGILSDTIFVIQANIAKEIAEAMNVVIAPEEEKVVDRFPTHSVEAYELQIRGRHELREFRKTLNDEQLNTARDFFRRALNKDSEYLPAIYSIGMTFLAEQNYDSALYYAEKAVALDFQYSDGYLLKAECYYIMGKYDLAVENYLTALELSQFELQDLKIWGKLALGRALAARGDALTALPHFAEVLKMKEVTSTSVYTPIANAFADIGDYDRATRYYQLAALKDACYGIIYHVNMFLAQNKPQQALEVIKTRCNQGCERLCTLSRFRISLLMDEFDKSEHYYSQ